MGAGRLCGRLRQRRLYRSVRDVLGAEPSVSQREREALLGCDDGGALDAEREAVQHWLRLCGHRPRRAFGPICGELSEVRSDDDISAWGKSVLFLSWHRGQLRTQG